ncbi:MAG: hypothetical protein CRN43_07565 [Candidatus Nephrothrix sp. EaCA]|nr:MAG: hypothetical protein CRN43_07565 [Candidatus Nephrothrix sp. EaCA]
MKYLLISSALILLGCETVITVDMPKTKPKIVVDGVFNPDSVWAVKISLSQHVLNGTRYEHDWIEDNEIKEITIRDENNTLIESLQYKDKKSDYFIDRYYKGKSKPSPNKSYKLEILTASYGTVTASDAAPPSVPIASARIDSTSEADSKIVRIEFSDDGNTADYYEIYLIGYSIESYYIKGYDNPPQKRRSYGKAGFIIKDDPAYEDRITNYETLIFDDALFNGKKATFNLKKDSFRTPTQVVLRHISADFYKFAVSKKTQKENEENPFSEPVFIQGNVQDGFGIFAGYSVSVYQL